MKQVLLVAALVLSACGVKPVTVTETKTQYATLDNAWLVDCPTVPPPDRLVYKAATLQQRVDMWTATYVEQAKINAKCRVNTQEARKYNALKRDEVSILTCSQGECK